MSTAATLQHNAIVTQRIEVAPGLIILRIVPSGWELPTFTAGQFATVGLPASAPRTALADADEADNAAPLPAAPRWIRRAYSIASSSVAHEYLELYITLVHSGELTPRLFALRPGDALHLGHKFAGMFTLDGVPADKHVVMVGTGTGLAPYMSMLRTHLPCGSPRHFAVLLGARHSWDLGYRSELITLQRLCANFHYLPVISRPDEEPAPWHAAVGRVQDLWRSDRFVQAIGFRPTPADTHVLLCGNPSMVEEMLVLLTTEGFREHTRRHPGEIHVERYW